MLSSGIPFSRFISSFSGTRFERGPGFCQVSAGMVLSANTLKAQLHTHFLTGNGS